MKKLIVPVVCVLVGCAAGAAMPAITAQSYGGATSGAQRWENYCAFEEAASLNPNRSGGQNEYNAVLQRMGSEGWELVGTAWSNTPCFRRPAQ